MKRPQTSLCGFTAMNFSRVLYASIRIGTICLFFIIGMAASPALSQEKGKAKASQPAKSSVLKPEFVAACKETLGRIVKEAMKGADAQFSSSDLAVKDVCGSAVDAAKVSTSLSTPSQALKARIKPELIESAKKTSGVMVAEFNQNGTNASFSSSDTREASSFSNVLIAVNALKMADSPVVKKNMKPELIAGAKKEAESIIENFNKNGYVELSYFDVMNLQEFASKLSDLGK